ncbi:hypothetical protein K9K77_03015, partial [Candidatus Babeliales bacterium]|nr:hypothetical protein [Candidatus Babeliales bacterium]
MNIKRMLFVGVLLSGMGELWGYDFFGASLSIDKTVNTAYKFADGMVGIDWGGANDFVYSLTVDSNGKILIGGCTNNGGTGSDFAVARLNANGTLDTDFGASLSNEKTVNTSYKFADGMVGIDLGGGDDVAWSLTVDSNGKILIGGYTNNGGIGTYDFAVTRLNPNGTLDTDFGASLSNEKIANTGYK